MPNLVARFAENTFWLGRYLERVEDLARILDITETYARDPATGPDWPRVLNLYSDTARFAEKIGESTASNVLGFYLLDKENPSSIVSTLTMARENARSVRHLISTEMWTQINVFHSELLALNRTKVTPNTLSSVARDIILSCQTFEGIAEGTFFRSEPWCFYQLGKYLERADQTTRILDMGYDRLSPAEGDEVAWIHWSVLLRSVSGYHAYRSMHPGQADPQQIASFLLYDTTFPRAIARCVQRVTASLRELERRHSAAAAPEIEVQRMALANLIERGPGKRRTSNRLHRYLDEVQASLGELSNAIGAYYFEGR